MKYTNATEWNFKMEKYPEKIFEEKTQNSRFSVQISWSALMTLGISQKKAQQIHKQLQRIVRVDPSLNRYNILLNLAEKIYVAKIV